MTEVAAPNIITNPAGDIWFISDTHFFHENILKFTGADGELIRAGFRDMAHMNQFMIEMWNSAVKPGHKVYHLGDVTFKYQDNWRIIAQQLNGYKRLCVGNHDKIEGTNLTNFFQKVLLWRVFGQEGFICSHIPLHPSSFDRFSLKNPNVRKVVYFNVSVEAVNYRPVHIDEIKHIISEMGDVVLNVHGHIHEKPSPLPADLKTTDYENF